MKRFWILSFHAENTWEISRSEVFYIVFTIENYLKQLLLVGFGLPFKLKRRFSVTRTGWQQQITSSRGQRVTKVLFSLSTVRENGNGNNNNKNEQNKNKQTKRNALEKTIKNSFVRVNGRPIMKKINFQNFHEVINRNTEPRYVHHHIYSHFFFI